MGVEAAAIVGGAQIVGSLLQAGAGERMAEAQGRGAMAQLAAAERERALEMKLRQETRTEAMKLAKLTPQEIANLEKANSALETDLKRKEELIASADPALLEAGKQALQLLKGQEAATLDPVRRQRQKDRQLLESKLRARLGSGYETSSAGQQALNEFDAQTGALLTNAQQQSLSQLLGVTQNVRNTSSVTGTAQALADIGGKERNRELNALLQTPLVPGTSTVPYAGAPFVTEYGRAANERQLIGDLTGGVSLAALLGSMGPQTATTPGGGLDLAGTSPGVGASSRTYRT